MIQDYLKVSLPFHQIPTANIAEEAQAILHFYDECCQSHFVPVTDLRHGIPFQFIVPSDIVGRAVTIYNADTLTLVAPTPPAVTDLAVRTDSIHGSPGTWQIYEGLDTLAADLPLGNYFLRFQIVPPTGPDLNFISEVFQVCNFTVDFMESDSFDEVCHEINDSDDLLMLEWWSDCDFDDIIYSMGYRNRLYLEAELRHPIEEITKDVSDNLGVVKPNNIIVKKKYQFKIFIPEYVWNALIRLPIYGSNLSNFHATITTPEGDCAEMSETDILGEWNDADCMNNLTIQFMDEEYPVIGTNCCDDLDVSIV